MQDQASKVIAIAAGEFHSVAAREDGSVVAWGLNDSGQTNAPPLTNAIAAAAGNKHSLALRDSGTVAAWGRNNEGQTNVPSGLTNVIAVAAGGNQSMALLSNGTVTNWGNTFGTIPGNLTNAISIAAGTNFCLALRSNGNIAAWGSNDDGQTNVPANATNLVAIAAGDFHALALKENGTVVAWGLNTSQQTNVPSGLSNVMAIAAGRAHSAALKNDGRIVCWGDNSAGQTDIGAGLKAIKLLAAGGEHTLASAFSTYVQYAVDVTKDLLLIYNSGSTNSVVVKDYYLAHRPMVSNANVLGIACPTNEITDDVTFTNQILTPYQNWLDENPTKHPHYLILFLDVPARVHNTNGMNATSTSVRIYQETLGIKPFVTHINMEGTNDCIAYINKLAAFGTNGQVLISASAGGYGNRNYLIDGIRHAGPAPFENYSADGYVVFSATNGLIAAGTPTNAILLADGLEICLATNSSGQCTDIQELAHPMAMTNVAGYVCWGFHSSLQVHYPSTVQWSGDSGWWLIETIESFNGQRSIYGGPGLFLKWFSSSAFGGTNYSNTPVGGVTHVEEPGLEFVNNASVYFGLWASGKNFAISAWNSGATPFFQAIGDPLVAR